MSSDKTVIIGGGQAAAKCAMELRRIGYDGQIAIYGAESTAPYQRPELSKSYLARPASADELVMLTTELAGGLGIELHTGKAVTRVDPEQRSVVTEDGAAPFDKLVFATGGSARKMRGALSLRTLDDALQLHNTLKREKQLLIAGGGWLGLEVAATARSHGLDVKLYEQNDRLCARSLPPEISELLLSHHQQNGVDITLGSRLPDDIAGDTPVCACLGIEPNDSLATSAGIDVDRGILVNERQMTSVPNVFAIGDCAREVNRPAMENWAYANVSAERAAHAVCDVPVPVNPDWWLWSKQGDLLIQMRGDYRLADEFVVRQKGDRQCYFYLADNKLVCCVAINDPAAFGQTRKLYRSGTQLDKTRLANPHSPLL